MKTDNFTYSFTTSKPIDNVFSQLLNVKQWWTGLYEETIKGKSSEVGDEFNFKAGGGAHDSTQRLVELVPGKKITWLVTESELSFLKHPGEWTGTQFGFELSPAAKGTKVTFTHQGLTPHIECYGACSAGWTGYLDNLKKSLA